MSAIEDGNQYLISIDDIEKCIENFEIETLPPPVTVLNADEQIAMFASAIAAQQEVSLPIFSHRNPFGMGRSIVPRSLIPLDPLPDGAYGRFNRNISYHIDNTNFTFLDVSLVTTPVDPTCWIKKPILEIIAFTPSKTFYPEPIPYIEEERETGNEYKFHIETF